MMRLFFMNMLFAWIQAKNTLSELFVKHHHLQAINQGTEYYLDSYSCTPGPASSECSYHGTCTESGDRCICDPGYHLELVYTSTWKLLSRCQMDDSTFWCYIIGVCIIILLSSYCLAFSIFLLIDFLIRRRRCNKLSHQLHSCSRLCDRKEQCSCSRGLLVFDNKNSSYGAMNEIHEMHEMHGI